MLEKMAFHLNQLQTATKIKLLTFPLSLGFTIEKIEEDIFSDFSYKLKEIYLALFELYHSALKSFGVPSFKF